MASGMRLLPGQYAYSIEEVPMLWLSRALSLPEEKKTLFDVNTDASIELLCMIN